MPAPSSFEEKKGFLAKSSGLNQASPARFECWRRERDRVYNLGLPGGFATRVGGKSGLLHHDTAVDHDQLAGHVVALV